MKNDKRSFQELVQDAERRIHFGLLESGAKGMRAALHISFIEYDNWLKAQKEIQQETNKRSRPKKER